MNAPLIDSKRVVRILMILGGVLLVALLMALPVAAQEGGPTDDEVNEIAQGLYCPVCENIPLDVCPTQACKQWRETIRERLALGWSKDQIEDYFVAQYGDRVLASPPARGLNWAVYVLPPAAFLVGGAILFQAIRSWRRRDEAEQSPATETSAPADPYLAQLEEELKRRA